MRITDVPFAVMRVQYEMARYPFQLIDEQVAARLGSEAPARLFYKRSLDVLDATVGVALGDRGLAERGVALAARRDALGRAANLDTTATAEPQQVDDELKAKRDKAIKDEIGTRDAKLGEVSEVRIDAEERKRTPQKAAAKRPTPQSGRLIRALPGARKRLKLHSATTSPESSRPSRMPPRLPRPSSKTRSRSAAMLRTSARRPIRSRIWPTRRSRSAQRSGTPPTPRTGL